MDEFLTGMVYICALAVACISVLAVLDVVLTLFERARGRCGRGRR